VEVWGIPTGTGLERFRKARDREGVGVVISSNHTVRKHITSSLCGSKSLGLLSSVKVTKPETLPGTCELNIWD
jgi:hypothetical protein